LGEYKLKAMRFLFKMGLFTFVSFIIVIIGLYTYAFLSPKLELKTAGQFYINDGKD